MKNILKLLTLITSFLLFGIYSTFATQSVTNEGETLNTQIDGENIEYEVSIEQEVSKAYRKEISINTDFEIDLSSLIQKLKILNPGNDYIVKWEILGINSEQTGETFTRTFSEKGEKEIALKIYQTTGEDDEPQIVYDTTIELLVFEKSLPLIISSESNDSELENYLNYAKKDGIYIYKIGPFNDESEIELANIIGEIEKYEKIPGLKSDYVGIWGNREFLFNLLSKINREMNLSNNEGLEIKYNIIAISEFNINVLEGYIKNFLADKSWINKILLVNENSKYLLLNENLISLLEEKLQENNYDYININLDFNTVNNFFILSKFINNLSNAGYSTDNIYLFLVIPLILTLIVFSKHFIGFSAVGLTVPLFITLMFLKLGYLISLFLIITFVILNLLLSIFIERNNLLYGPKMTFTLIINFISFIIILNLLVLFDLINLDLNDIMFFIIFIVICERFINILVSKDIGEYKKPFLYTILISSISFYLLNLSQVKLLLLSLPEMILILVPINFLIGKFTGLRVTEYFRFKEIIKTVEE